MNFKEQIDALKKSYDCNLVTFKEYYVLMKQYPADEQYSKKFMEVKTTLTRLAKNLFLLNNELQVEIEKMKNDSATLNQQLGTQEGSNGNIKKEIDLAKGEVGGSVQMSEDYKVLYTRQYITNWSMFIGILVAGWVSYTTFSKRE